MHVLHHSLQMSEKGNIKKMSSQKSYYSLYF